MQITTWSPGAPGGPSCPAEPYQVGEGEQFLDSDTKLVKRVNLSPQPLCCPLEGVWGEPPPRPPDTLHSEEARWLYEPSHHLQLYGEPRVSRPRRVSSPSLQASRWVPSLLSPREPPVGNNEPPKIPTASLVPSEPLQQVKDARLLPVWQDCPRHLLLGNIMERH